MSPKSFNRLKQLIKGVKQSSTKYSNQIKQTVHSKSHNQLESLQQYKQKVYSKLADNNNKVKDKISGFNKKFKQTFEFNQNRKQIIENQLDNIKTNNKQKIQNLKNYYQAKPLKPTKFFERLKHKYYIENNNDQVEKDKVKQIKIDKDNPQINTNSSIRSITNKVLNNFKTLNNSDIQIRKQIQQQKPKEKEQPTKKNIFQSISQTIKNMFDPISQTIWKKKGNQNYSEKIVNKINKYKFFIWFLVVSYAIASQIPTQIRIYFTNNRRKNKRNRINDDQDEKYDDNYYQDQDNEPKVQKKTKKNKRIKKNENENENENEEIKESIKAETNN